MLHKSIFYENIRVDTITILSPSSSTDKIYINSAHVETRRLRASLPPRMQFKSNHMDLVGAIAFQSQKQSSSQDWQLTMASVLHNILRRTIHRLHYFIELTSLYRWIRLDESFPTICGSKNGRSSAEGAKVH